MPGKSKGPALVNNDITSGDPGHFIFRIDAPDPLPKAYDQGLTTTNLPLSQATWRDSPYEHNGYPCMSIDSYSTRVDRKYKPNLLYDQPVKDPCP